MTCTATMDSMFQPGHVHTCIGKHDTGDHFCGECQRYWYKAPKPVLRMGEASSTVAPVTASQPPSSQEVALSDTQTSTIEPTFVAPGEPVATEQPAAPAAPHVEPAEPVAPVVPATEPTVEPTVEPDAADEEKPARAAKTELESEVKKVTDSFVTGELTLGDGEHLTPHRIAKAIKEARGADKSPSTGAVSSVLQRWESYGFATVSEKPKAFLDYTEAGREKGLSAMKAAAREAKRASAPVAADSASAPGVSPAEPADTV